MPSTDDWSTNADSNATTLGINIGELCDSANINNAMREMMAQLKTKLDEVDANLDGSSDPTLASIAALTVAANKFLYTTATDTFAAGTITPFARSLLDDATASAMRTTLGIPTSSAVTVTALSLTSTGGYIRLSLGGTPFTFVYKDATAGANGSTTVTYPTIDGDAPFTSFSRAWLRGGRAETDAKDNDPYVSTSGTANCTLYSAADSSVGVTVFAFGA